MLASSIGCVKNSPQKYCVLALIVSAALSARSFGADADATLFPHKLGEIKAMVQLLSPRKGGHDSVQQEYLKRLTLYRYLCDVPFETLQWDEHLADLATHASIICNKNNKLSHSPPKPAGMSDADYDICRTGAGQSNLFEGVFTPGPCVDGWMDDTDPTNIDRVGHRRWCLSPDLQKTGFGSSGKFAAMHVFDHSNRSVPDWDFISYPARGYMPVEFFGSRVVWSISPNPEKYAPPPANVKVSIHAADAKFEPTGSSLNLDYLHVDLADYGGGPAIIFRPAGSAPRDGAYVVEVTGMKKKSGGDAVLRYVVQFVNLQKISVGADGAAVYSKYYQQRLTTIQAMTDKVDQAEALSQLADERVSAIGRRECQRRCKESADGTQ